MRGLLPSGDLSCGERQERFSRLNAFHTEQRVRRFADVAGPASRRDHFHTIVIAAKASKANGFADDGRVFLKSGRPETVRENENAGSVGTVVLRSDETTEDKVEVHDFMVRAVDDARLNFARLPDVLRLFFSFRPFSESVVPLR